ncbi:ROK family transcriptional regulator [Brachybacterium sp. P6-10-X1]|uniref:ROK family transcriptional regulator n=1 Tax=Brachybacterium sp. P6-10-X1 TaxID=1903186 RepID=UPI0012FA7A25|nr:ROK family transcriptional regulator [Brachybacterium sp. P6-10-X1]
MNRTGRTQLMESQRNGTASAILRTILRDGPVGRKQLAAATGSSFTTITRSVRDLLERGALVERDAVRSPAAAGRPVLPLDLPGPEVLVVGTHLHPQRTTVGAFTLRGERIHDAARPAGGSSTEARARDAALLTREVIDELEGSAVVGIGVATPWAEDRLASLGPRPWDIGYDVMTEAMRSTTGLPVWVDSNVRALAVEHHWWAGMRGNVLTILVGRSIGLAQMREEELVWSGRGTGGIVSHIQVPGSEQRCGCGQVGCIAATCTDDALLERAIATGALPPGSRQQDLLETAPEDADQLTALRAGRVRELGLVLPPLIDLVDPDLTILRGTFGTPEEIEECLALIRGRYREIVGRDVRIEHRAPTAGGNWARASAALAVHGYVNAPLLGEDLEVESATPSP